MSQMHQGEPTTGGQFQGLVATILLAIIMILMLFTSVSYSGSAAEGSPGKPVPTVARR
jgi:hypothetical protein